MIFQPENQTEAVLEEERKAFDNPQLKWKDVMNSGASVKIPSGFTMDVIFTFLSMVFVSANDLDLRDLNENLNVGTEKPTVKGRQMYSSERVTLCEFVNQENNIFFRANVSASMGDKKEPARYPCVKIGKDGKVSIKYAM